MYFCEACGKLLNKTNKYYKVDSKHYCSKHYFQIRKYGKVQDNNPRTVYDDNEIRVKHDYAEIDTYDNKGNVLVTYKLDVEDVPLLKGHKWRTVFKGKENDTPYMVTGHTIYFHRLVMGNVNNEIDHINRDSSDNRKSNLRESYRTQQLANTSLRRDNTHGIKGVYFDKRNNKYHAEIQIFKKKFFSKTYDTLAEAAYYRYLLEEHFYKTIGINNSQKMIELIQSLTQEQKYNIQTYFSNRMKVQVDKI